MKHKFPSGWTSEKLGNLFAINPKHSKESDLNELVSFVPMAAISEISGSILEHGVRPLHEVWKGYTHFSNDDVIFAKITPCMENGKTAIASNLKSGKACGSTEFYVFRSKGGSLPAFLHKYLRQQQFRDEAKKNMSGAVGHLRVPKNFIENYEFPVPPLNEQKRIVEKVDALMERSEAAKEALDAIPALLDQYRQSVLAAAFRGDLTKDWREQNPNVEHASDLVMKTAKAEQPRGGRKPTAQIIKGVAGLSVNVATDAVAPKSWTWLPLLEIARQETGHTPSRKHSEYWGGDVHWLGIADAKEHHGKEIQNSQQRTNALGLANSAARLLPKNTVCLSRTASVGYVTILGREMATSQDFVTWTCTEALLPQYLMFALMAEGEAIRNFGKGTTHTTIYFPEIRAMHICLPPIEEQKEIVRICETTMRAIDVMSTQVSAAEGQLSKLTNSILAEAFRGELVPQDPSDEPASKLLDRVKAEREATTKNKPKRTGQTKTA